LLPAFCPKVRLRPVDGDFGVHRQLVISGALMLVIMPLLVHAIMQ
jgi:hypothetical protein